MTWAQKLIAKLKVLGGRPVWLRWKRSGTRRAFATANLYNPSREMWDFVFDAGIPSEDGAGHARAEIIHEQRSIAIFTAIADAPEECEVMR